MNQQHGLITTLHYSISFCAQTHPGMVRKVNEDSFVVIDSPAVFCVADGMGGYDAGEVASASVVQSIETFYAFNQNAEVTLPDDFSMEMFNQHPLCGSVEFAHQQLQKKMNSRIMGSTFAAVQFEEGGVAVCHVGDSRVYLLHHGTLIQLTRDHSVVSALVENGDITSEQARKHPQRNAILQAVGFSPEIKPDLQHFAVRQGDKLLICSDGVTSMLSDEQITQILITDEDIDRQSQRIIDQTNEAGGKDNITLILIEIN